MSDVYVHILTVTVLDWLRVCILYSLTITLLAREYVYLYILTVTLRVREYVYVHSLTDTLLACE